MIKKSINLILILLMIGACKIEASKELISNIGISNTILGTPIDELKKSFDLKYDNSIERYIDNSQDNEIFEIIHFSSKLGKVNIIEFFKMSDTDSYGNFLPESLEEILFNSLGKPDIIDEKFYRALDVNYITKEWNVRGFTVYWEFLRENRYKDIKANIRKPFVVSKIIIKKKYF